MITFVKGDIFDSTAQVITNTVNCVVSWVRVWPLSSKTDIQPCMKTTQALREKGSSAGKTLSLGKQSNPDFKFSTKRRWKDNSMLDDIEDGLKYLAQHYKR